MQYASDATMTIVFSCCQPSLVVSYDTVQATHSVWVLRKVTPDVRAPTQTKSLGTNPNTVFLFLTVPFFAAPGAFFGVAVRGRSSKYAITSDGVRVSDLSPP